MPGLPDETRRALQDHFSDALVTVIGSGHSAAIGIPGMRELAAELQREMPARAGAHLQEWQRVAERLQTGDPLEGALDELDAESELIGEIVALTAAFIAAAERTVIADILCGRTRLALAELLATVAFTGEVRVITTNYDRIVELAAELAGLGLDCSFPGAHACPFDPKLSHAAMRSELVTHAGKPLLRYRRHVELSKPHGSLDWYMREGVPFRTPYEVDLAPLMITPGAAKYRLGYEVPFDRHREQANHAIDAAARILTIGYGFNDPQLQTHMLPRIRAGAPTLIISRTLSDAARALLGEGPNVTAIERRRAAGTLIHTPGETIEVPGAELWSIDGFLDQVLA